MSKLLVECTFYSDTTHEEVGKVLLYKDADGSGKLIRKSFTGELTLSIPQEDIEELEILIREKDAMLLHEYDCEITPFYCPECGRNYSKSEWLSYDDFDDDHPIWHDSIRGICPAGHERMLED